MPVRVAITGFGRVGRSVDGTQVRAVAWYDSEGGYSSRLVDLAQRVVPVAEPA